MFTLHNIYKVVIFQPDILNKNTSDFKVETS